MSVRDAIAALETMPSAALRGRWSELVGGPVPRISPKLLRLALAWEIQARAHGGLSRATNRQGEQRRGGRAQTSLLAGKVIDSQGQPLVATHAAKARPATATMSAVISRLRSAPRSAASVLTRVLRLAFLAPAVTEAILAGKVRPDVNVGMLTLRESVEPGWAEQVATMLPNTAPHRPTGLLSSQRATS